MKRISWSRVCVYALIYLVTGVAVGTAIAYGFMRFGPGVGQFMVLSSLAASMIVAAFVSFALALRSPTRPFMHATLAYLLSQLVAFAFLSLLLGAGGALANRALEFALMLIAIFLGSTIGLSSHWARAGSNARPFEGSS